MTNPLDAILRFADAQLGKPYLWGGEGPNSFDCSGLTMDAYKQAGISLPHNAQAQFAQTQSSIVRGALQPGDLVFFGSAGRIHHVGIAVGGGKMIDAPHHGANVRIEPIAGDFFAATRPLGGSGFSLPTPGVMGQPVSLLTNPFGSVVSGAKKIVMEALFALAGLSLIALGVYRMFHQSRPER
jgi:NlpC/P60 family